MGIPFLKKIASETKSGRAATILLKRKEIKKEIRRQLEMRLEDAPSKWQVNWCYRDYLRFYVRYRGSLDVDYFNSQLYRKSEFVRRESFATHIRFTWRDACQEKTYWPVFNNKIKFYTAFSEDLHRKWLVVDNSTTDSEIREFADHCRGHIFTKEPESCGGKDVAFWNIEREGALRELLEFCRGRKSPLIVEEALNQCDDIASFSNYKAVNTFRIITIVDESGIPHVAKAAFRMGRSDQFVDNFSGGGYISVY